MKSVAGVTGSNLKRRIRAIVTQRGTQPMKTGEKLLVAAAGLAAIVVPIAVGVLNLPRIQAQSAPADAPKFDVVSLKACQEPPQVPGAIYPSRGNSSPGNLRTNCFPLLDPGGMGLIRGAYASDPFTPIDGAPSWVRSAFYEIDARADGSPSVATMRGPMMRVLLEDRFHLKIHHETREGPVYFLTVARGGPKLRAFADGTCTPASKAPPCFMMVGLLNDEKGHILSNEVWHVDAQGATLDEFSRQLRPVLDRPAINQTGIAGRFDISVKFSREGALPASDPSGYPSIFTAVREQLGLGLEAGKGPVDRFVIDHIERPAEK